MQPCFDSGQWSILPDPKHTAGRLDSVTGAPPGDERARERGIAEVDRHRVVENPAHPRRCHRPPARTAILIEPSRYVGMPLAETFCRNTYPDADWKASL